jgi:alpha-ketoglutarate-dependent taurine dioxygenase
VDGTSGTAAAGDGVPIDGHAPGWGQEGHYLRQLPGVHQRPRWLALASSGSAAAASGEVVPPYGGDTQWSNLVAAYEGLSESLRGHIDGRRATAHLSPTDRDHIRLYYRMTLEGDVPVGPDGQPSRALEGEPFVAI